MLDALTVFYAHALAGTRVKINAQAATAGGDAAEAAAAVVRLATLPDDGPSGLHFSWNGTVAPW